MNPCEIASLYYKCGANTIKKLPTSLHDERLVSSWTRNWQRCWKSGRRRWTARNVNVREKKRDTAADQNATKVAHPTTATTLQADRIMDPTNLPDVVAMDTVVVAMDTEVEVGARETENDQTSRNSNVISAGNRDIFSNNVQSNTSKHSAVYY